jgi:cysteine desulfurase/selenocysteine lyase
VLNVEKIRRDFPVLDRKVHGKQLVYFDNAATSQKPKIVIESLRKYYEYYNSNIHRSVHTLAEEATEAHELVRDKVASFIKAGDRKSIVFTRNTTESINLIANSWGGSKLKRGDKILLTVMEHHSNIVPWQLLAKKMGLKIDYLPITQAGYLDISEGGRLEDDLLKSRLNGVKLLGIGHASNVVGTINPVYEICKIAKEMGVTTVVDAAQSVPHMPVDVSKMDCDFLAFSAHKMLGPTGVGVLYAKPELLEEMPPFLGGGEMISEVHLTGSKWNDIPLKFEAGTSNIADVIAFGVAIDYLKNIRMEVVRNHEVDLTRYALEVLLEMKDVNLYGPLKSEHRAGLVAFNLAKVHPHDLASYLDQEGIAIRSGQHCAQPLHEWFSVQASSRASFYIYNTKQEIDLFAAALQKARRFFAA